MPKFDLSLIKKLAASGKIKPETLKAAMGEVEKILAHVDTPEKAVKLQGAEREAYLKALDVTYGPTEARAQAMNMSDPLYHGTNKDFEQFGTENLGASGRKHGEKYFFSDNPEVANEFAEHSAVNDFYLKNIKDPAKFDHALDEKLEKQARKAASAGDSELAEKIDDQRREMRFQGQRVLPVRISSTKPYTTNAAGKYFDEKTMNRVFKNADHEGSDAVFLKNLVDTPGADDGLASTVAVVSDPSKIRSTNAAFDPRFAKSPLIMAGAAAAPSGFENPLDMIKPALDAYEGAKEKVTGKLANEMDLTKDKSATEAIQTTLGLVADPLNFVPGPLGLGAAAVQGMGAMTPQKPRFDAAQLQGLYKGGKISEKTFKAATGYATGGISGQAPLRDVGLETPEIVPQFGSGYQVPSVGGIVASLGPERMPAPTVAEVLQKTHEFSGSQNFAPAKPSDEPMVDVVQTEPAAQQMPGPQPGAGTYEDVNKAFDQFAGAINAQSAAAAKEGQINANFLNQQAAIMQENALKDEQLQYLRKQQLDEQTAKIDQATREFTSSKVDPNRYWADKTTGQRIGMGIALFFSGVNGSNDGFKILENAINRDIEAQRAQIAGKREAVDLQKNMLSTMLNRFGDERMALAATRVSAYQMAEIKLKAALAPLQGSRNYAEGAKSLVELQIKKADVMKDFIKAAQGSAAFRNADALSQKILAIPDKGLQEKAWNEKEKYDGIVKARSEIAEMYKTAPWLEAKIPGTGASAQEKANEAKVFTAVKLVVGEKMSEGDKSLIEPFVPRGGDTVAQRKVKQQNLDTWILNRVGERTPILTGLGIVPRQVTLDIGKPVN